MTKMRVYKWERGEEIESEVELYEDLELVLVQEVEKDKDKDNVEMVGPSSTNAS